ncbi:PepSY-like domain-containing protein [uncultured Muribaculum sp.]|jgi:hypothetical protein|uniref:PepSY-like domain-containing protein n=2 Tax=uncultured Muribaculum sp. TaxID=1918613 RepID=UPI0025B08973|nr:PepSY-like domain-containing protein [uncultured Muribaculum sp.]
MNILQTLTAGLALALSVSAGVAAQSQQKEQQPVDTNPGIFLGGTASVGFEQLPDNAIKFITDNFAYKQINKCEKDYPEGSFEVELRDGTEIDFAPDGTWTEIDAADNTTLPETLLKKILNPKAYDELVKRGYVNLVENVERTASGGMKIELDKIVIDEIIFDINGTVVAVIED